MKMTELAKILHGISEKEIEKAMKEHNLTGLVVVYGYSDDNTEFRGEIKDELGSYDGGKFQLDKNGLIVNECDDEDCPYFNDKKDNAPFFIEAHWCVDDGLCWTFTTNIPHETFIMVDYEGNDWCRGIVFKMSALSQDPTP